ncbi:MAG: hypothetical protein AB4372_02185 [Xenococcus sp. (in: cyanobacteria)]
MRQLLLGRGKLFIIFWGIINVFVVACDSRKYAECQQIITLANNVTQQTQAIAEGSSDRDLENWLEASEIMKQAATNIENLEIKDNQLVEYQAGLVDIYQIYAQATYDAVKARESRNLQALQSARDEAKNAGKVNNDLVKNINNYCIEK